MTELHSWIIKLYFWPEFIPIVVPELSIHGCWVQSPSISSSFWRKCASRIVSRESNSSHCSDEETECKSKLFASFTCLGRESVAYKEVANDQTFVGFKGVQRFRREKKREYSSLLIIQGIESSINLRQCLPRDLSISDILGVITICRSSTLRSKITSNWQRYAENWITP